MLSVGVGLFLVVFMIVIAAGVFMLLAGASKDPASAKKINSETGMLLLVYGIFATVIAFGLNAIAGGLWMLIAGKRNRIFVWLMWVILFLIFVVGGVFRALADR